MAKLQIVAGATSQSVNVFIRDSSSTTGAGLAAVAPAGGSLLAGTKLYYSFTGTSASAGVAVSLSVLAAVNSAWSSAGIVTIDGTNMVGWVRIDIPNAALATSSGRCVSFLLFGGTNMAPTPFEIELTAINNQDGVRAGLTALPNAAADAAGGLFTMAASILTSPTANTVGEALYMMDATRGRFGTAQAGSATTITLDAGASAIDNRYSGYNILLSAGTGGGLPGTAGQERTIVSYNGTTKVATVDSVWGTNPDNTTVFKLISHQSPSALLDQPNGIETSFTPRQAARIILASQGGKVSGAATTNVKVRDVGDTKDRINATVDSSGNRTAVTLDAT